MIEIIGGIVAVVLFVLLLPVILQLAAAATAIVLLVLAVLAAVLTLVSIDDEIRVFVLCLIAGSAVFYWISRREKGPPTKAQQEEARKVARRKRLDKLGFDAPIIPPMPDRSSPEWPDWRDRKGKWVDR